MSQYDFNISITEFSMPTTTETKTFDTFKQLFLYKDNETVRTKYNKIAMKHDNH
jgi:hypothetical protein